MFDFLFHILKYTVEWFLTHHFPEQEGMFRIDYDKEQDFISVSNHTEKKSSPLRKRSKILDHLQSEYEIQSIPQDGNCFYHSIVVSLNLKYDAYTLRSKVANILTEEEINLIRATRWPENTPDACILKAIQTTEWADHIEICACLRLLPNVLLVIIDDEFDTITFHGKMKKYTDAIFIRRDVMHYEIVKLKDASKVNVLKMKRKGETIHVGSKSQSTV